MTYKHPATAVGGRTVDPVAWRIWPVSPKHLKGPCFEELALFNLNNNLVPIGFMASPMCDSPTDRDDFKAVTGENDIAYLFAHVMRRGDIVMLARNRSTVIAWGLLVDDVPFYFDDVHPLWEDLQAIRKQIWRKQSVSDDEREQLLNYRRVDHWRWVNAPLQNPDKMFPGNIRATVASHTEEEAIQWLGIEEDLGKARHAIGEPSRVLKKGETPRVRNSSVDVGRKRAVELRAMEVARKYYEANGYSVLDTSSNNPYDFLCSKDKKELRVEVKGRSSVLETVDFTHNEVNSARLFTTDLFIVSNIVCEGHGDDAKATGGVATLFSPWVPDDDDLEPTAFRYQVPTNGKRIEI